LDGILVIDHKIHSLETIERTLHEDFHVFTAISASKAFQILETESISVIICDQEMPNIEGVRLLCHIRKHWPDIPRIMISGFIDAESIIDAVNEAGIYHYITKPWYPEQLTIVVKKAAEQHRLQAAYRHLSPELNYLNEPVSKRILSTPHQPKQGFYFHKIVCSPNGSMQEQIDDAAKIARFDVSVMISGESGTGKELLARALHYNSKRADQPFVIENCGAIQKDLLCSELFGHKKGAFTGAVADHIGLFEKANGGTIFLDEIGETSADFQVKLLRVLQGGEIRPLGSNESKKVDVRVISATNRDLKQDIANRLFRADLYYRLTTMTLQIAPLRERTEDIELIANHLLHKFSLQFGIKSTYFTEQLIEQFKRYSWPGNVREMENEIKRMLVLATRHEIDVDMLSADFANSIEDCDTNGSISLLQGSLKEQVEQLEKQLLIKILRKYKWNKSQAALHLGLSRVGLTNKIERYSLNGTKDKRIRENSDTG